MYILSYYGKFRILVSQEPILTKTFRPKNACNFLNNGLIFKIYFVPETREQAPQYYLRYLISRICKNHKIESKNIVDLL